MKPNEHYVRILKRDSNGTYFAGSGILVNNRMVITCYHVIEHDNYDDKFEMLVEIPESYYSFPIPLSNPKIYSGIDLVIFKIDTPLDYLDHPIVLLKSGYSRLEGEECSVFINFGDYGRNEYGWTFSRIEKNTSDYLIQSTKRSDKYLSVDSGHSGTAVWYKNKGVNALVGMVKSADGLDSFDFISGEELIPYLDDVTLENIEIKNIYLPRDYIRLDRCFDKSIAFIYRDIFEGIKILVINGISGIGKTTLAVDLVKNLSNDFEWMDCRIIDDFEVFLQKIELIDNSGYIVLDGLDDSHNFFKNNWLEKMPKAVNLIITTSSKLCQNKIENKYKEHTVECVNLDGFNESESLRLLKDIDDNYVNSELKKLIYKLSKGIPIFLQLIKDIIVSDIEEKEEQYNSFSDNTYIFKVIDRELTEDELSDLIVKEWFDRSNIHSLKKEILYVLSCVSSLGMTLESINEILDWDKIQIRKTIESLRKKGFISPESDPKSREMIIRPHDLIKKITSEIGGFEKESYEKRFFEYIRDSEGDKCSLISRIDVLIFKMKNLWEKSNNVSYKNNFMKELQSYSISLNALIPRDTGSQYRSDWVAALFDPLTTKDCTILIPLSRTMGMFQANEVLADLAWSAMNKNIESDERDSFMARANLICCAFNHWKGLAVPQESILKKAKEHLVSLEVHQLMNNSEDPDLEASMVIGGMCSLGMQKEAIEIVSKGRFSQFSRDMDLSYLMILVSLCDGNISAERKSLIEEFILSKLRFTTENEAKDDVMDYLVLKGFHLDRVKHKNGKSFYVNYKNKRIRGLSMAIAKSTGNHEFRKFLVSNKKREGDVWV